MNNSSQGHANKQKVELSRERRWTGSNGESPVLSNLNIYTED